MVSSRNLLFLEDMIADWCPSSSWSQQDALVSQPDNQEVLRFAKDCSSSIVGLDSDSLSIISEGTELISINFDFDAVVLGSRVYQLAERSHLRQAIRGLKIGPLKTAFTKRGPSSPDSVSNILSTKDNDNESQYSVLPVPKTVYWQLRSTFTSQRRKGTQIPRMDTGNLTPLEPVPGVQRVVIAGISESGKSALHRSMLLDREEFSDRFRALLTDVIRDNLIEGTRKILGHMQRSDIPFNNDFLESYAFNVITVEDVWLIQSLWENAGFLEAYRQRSAYHLNEGYAYFVHHVKRIMDSGYLPSDQDLIHASVRTIGTQETRFRYKDITYAVIDTGGARSERKKWIHVMKHPDTVIFTVDVTCYAKTLVEDGVSNQLQEGLKAWESFLESPELSSSNLILIFTKVDLLGEWFRIATPKWFIQSHEQERHAPEEEDYVVPEEEFMQQLERRFMEVIESATHRRRVRVLRSSLLNVAVCNPGREIFKVLEELRHQGTV